jgi:transcriptional regulator with XRE-family HTH domain
MIFMANFDEIKENYSSNLIDDLLSKIKPEEQEQVDYKMKLAAKIYAGLRAKGWKSLDLAKALDLKSPSLVSKWLSGTHNFTVDTLVDIQRVLNIQLFNIELSESTPTLHVNFTVSVEPASLNEDIYGPLQRVIDEAGGLQATTLTIGS